jgi:ketosteroid isomerase-like protein
MSASVEVVSSYLEAFSRGEPDAIAAHVSDGFRNEHLSELGAGCVGRTEYRNRLPHFLEAFADRAYSIVEVVEQPRESVVDVVVRYRFTARFEGNAIDIPGMMLFSVRGREITRRVDCWDSLTFLGQTGQAST